jgi:hypothetical protein
VCANSLGLQSAFGQAPQEAQVRVHRSDRPVDPRDLGRPSWRNDAASYAPTEETSQHSALGSEEACSGVLPARTKETPWSEAELAVIVRYAWMSDDRVRSKLESAGYFNRPTLLEKASRQLSVANPTCPTCAPLPDWPTRQHTQNVLRGQMWAASACFVSCQIMTYLNEPGAAGPSSLAPWLCTRISGDVLQ